MNSSNVWDRLVFELWCSNMVHIFPSSFCEAFDSDEHHVLCCKLKSTGTIGYLMKSYTTAPTRTYPHPIILNLKLPWWSLIVHPPCTSLLIQLSCTSSKKKPENCFLSYHLCFLLLVLHTQLRILTFIASFLYTPRNFEDLFSVCLRLHREKMHTLFPTTLKWTSASCNEFNIRIQNSVLT